MTLVNRRGFLAITGGAAVAAATSQTAAHAATTTHILPVITANIGRLNHLSLAQNEARKTTAIRAVRSWTTDNNLPRPFVGWQEINEGDDIEERDNIADSFRDEYFQHRYMWRNEAGQLLDKPRVPVTFSRYFTVPEWQSYYCHDGTSNPDSPPRRITEVLLRSVHDSRIQVAMLNMHYIADAYNGDRLPRLQTLWNTMFDKHVALVKKWHDRGVHVIWTADTNRAYTPLTHSRERKIWDNEIDQVRWVPATNSVGISMFKTGNITLGIDGHTAKAAAFRLTYPG